MTATREHLTWLRQVAGDPEVTAFAVRVAVALTQYFNSKTGEAFPSQKRLAADLSASIDGVSRALRDLAKRGHLQTKPGSGRRLVSTHLPILKPRMASRVIEPKTPAGETAFGVKTPAGGTYYPPE